jgi:alpha-mannosidase
MMNLTGNDWQFGQGGWNEWTFRYRIVLLNEKFDPVRLVQEAQQYATPPFLQAPGQSPVLSGLEALEIDFSGGPLLAFKVAEDNRRLILRFWNTLNRVIAGSVRLPPGWSGAEICDALERSVRPLDATEGIVRFNANSLEILTIALMKRD